MAEPNPVAPVDATTATTEPQQGLSLWIIAWRRLRRNRMAMLGLIVILFLTVVSLLAPVIAPYDPNLTDPYMREQPPSAEHWLGTDTLGRDVFSRLVWAGRISLSVGVVGVLIYIVIGVVVGAVAGYYGGWVDNVVMRFTDIVIAFPYLALAMVVVAAVGAGIWTMVITLALLSWTTVARLVRGEFLSLRSREFVEAAHAMGGRDFWIVVRHMLPNAMAPVIVTGTLGVASLILAEAALSFLGLGVPQPHASWGNMLASANSLRVMAFQWWRWIPPGVVIFVAVLSLNLFGDGLRDALDPRLK